MRPLRILHVCQPVDGGAAAVTRHLAAAGRAVGSDVVVASPEGPLADAVRADGGRWVHVAMGRSPSLADARPLVALRRLFADADVVHLHSSKAGALGRMALRTLPVRRRPASVFTPHGWSFYVGGRAAAHYRRFERLAAPWVDAIVAVSPEELRDGAAVLGPAADRLLPIPNGVDPADFRPDGPRATRARDPLLVCVGRVCEQKGQDIAVRVLAALPDPTVRLRLVGDGPGLAEVCALADRLGVRDRVECVGQTDPRPHLRAADVVLLPSRWEGLSLLLLEAMATGCTVLASDAMAGQALGDAGVSLPLEAGPQVFAAQVQELLLDRVRRQRLGAAARTRVESSFSRSRTDADYTRLWTTLSAAAGV